MPLQNIADDQLLRQYLDERSAEAMDELVRRYSGLVHSAALRQVGRSDAADVSQAVFAILVRKAPSLRGKSTLGGWLVTATRYCAIDFMRRKSRQIRHEQAAASEKSEAALDTQIAAGTWAQLAPVLDGAMSLLSEIDRNAVVLRYFEDRAFGEIADRLGTTEEAARKRVDRALDKLHKFLTKKGVSLPAAAIGAGITANANAAAPESLVTTLIAQTRGATIPAGVMAIVTGAISLLAWARARFIATATLAGAACAIIVLVLVRFGLADSRDTVTPAPAIVFTQPPTIDDVINSLAAAEGRLQSIYTNGRADVDFLVDPNDPNSGWVATPGATVARVWRTSEFDGPFRIEILFETIEWTDGMAPYWENHFNASFDGTNLTHVLLAEGPIRQATPRDPQLSLTRYRTAEAIRAGRGFIHANGSLLSANFLGSSNKQTLSTKLRSWAEAEKRPSANPPYTRVTLDIRNGAQVVKASVGFTGRHEQSWWLDPSRGWAVLQSEVVTGPNRFVLQHFEATELRVTPDGIWYPSSGFCIAIPHPDRIGGDGRARRTRFNITEILINDPRIVQEIQQGVSPP